MEGKHFASRNLLGVCVLWQYEKITLSRGGARKVLGTLNYSLRAIMRHLGTFLQIFWGDRRRTRLRDWRIHLGFLKNIEDCLKVLAEEPGIRTLLQFLLFGLVTHLLPALLVVVDLLSKIISVLCLAQLSEYRVILHVMLILRNRSLPID